MLNASASLMAFQRNIRQIVEEYMEASLKHDLLWAREWGSIPRQEIKIFNTNAYQMPMFCQ